MKRFIVIVLLVGVLVFSGCAKKTEMQAPADDTPESGSQQPEQEVETVTNDSAEKPPVPVTELKRTPCSRDFSPALGSGPYYNGLLFDAHFHMPNFVDLSKIEGHGAEHEINPTTDPVFGKDVSLEKILCVFEKEKAKGAIGFAIGAEEALKETLLAAESVNKESAGKISLFLMPSNFEAGTLDEIQQDNPDLFKGYGEIAFYFRGTEKPDSQKFLDIYEVARKHKLIVMMHPDARQESEIENALQKNPNVKFILHGPEIENSIINLMGKYPNAYYSVDATLVRYNSPGALLYSSSGKEDFKATFTQNYDAILDDAVNDWKGKIEQHPDRYMWGTDRAHLWTYDEEVSVLLEEFSRDFIAELDPSVQEKFAYKNAEKLLEE